MTSCTPIVCIGSAFSTIGMWLPRYSSTSLFMVPLSAPHPSSTCWTVSKNRAAYRICSGVRYSFRRSFASRYAAFITLCTSSDIFIRCITPSQLHIPRGTRFLLPVVSPGPPLFLQGHRGNALLLPVPFYVHPSSPLWPPPPACEKLSELPILQNP